MRTAFTESWGQLSLKRGDSGESGSRFEPSDLGGIIGRFSRSYRGLELKYPITPLPYARGQVRIDAANITDVSGGVRIGRGHPLSEDLAVRTHGGS